MNSIQTNYNYFSGFSNICWPNLRFLSAKTDFCLFRKYNVMNEGIPKVLNVDVTIIFNLMGKLLSEEEPRSVDHSDQLEESYDTCDF